MVQGDPPGTVNNGKTCMKCLGRRNTDVKHMSTLGQSLQVVIRFGIWPLLDNYPSTHSNTVNAYSNPFANNSWSPLQDVTVRCPNEWTIPTPFEDTHGLLSIRAYGTLIQKFRPTGENCHQYVHIFKFPKLTILIKYKSMKKTEIYEIQIGTIDSSIPMIRRRTLPIYETQVSLWFAGEVIYCSSQVQ